MKTLRSTNLIVLTTALAAFGQGGCAPGPTVAGPDAAPPPKIDGAPPTPDDPLPVTSISRTRGEQVQAAVLPIGAVPYDGFSLPLVSPDGRWVATETGVAPDWTTVLAEPDAMIADATRIEIHAIQYEPTTVGLRHTLDDGVILGRAVDAEGFLVEWPRPDGSRWIGKTGWSSGETTWLVQDDAINAFATIGPDGRLAWSRRTIDADHFDLVVRDADGGEWSIAAEGHDWLYPAWSGRGDGLFLLHLDGENLSLAHAAAEDAAAFRQSIRAVTVSSRGSVYIAYQSVNGQPRTESLTPPSRERYIFFHPAQRRAAMWRPNSARPNDIALFNRASMTAAPNDDDTVLVPTAPELFVQPVANPKQRKSVLKGLFIPRPTSDPDWPFILLTPGEETVKLTALKLLPVGE